MTIADINEQPRRPQPVIRPFAKLDSVDKAAEIHRRTRLGQHVPQIAAELGVTDGAIYSVAREEGIALNSLQRTIWPSKGEPGVSNADPADTFSLSPARLARRHWERMTKAARKQRIAVGAAPPAKPTPPPPPPAASVPAPGPEVTLSPFRTKADLVIQEVAANHGFSVGELKTTRRLAKIVAARQEIFWRLSKETTMSLPQIGKKLGGFDHTTVLYGIRRHEERMGGAPSRKTHKARREPVWGVGGWH